MPAKGARRTNTFRVSACPNMRCSLSWCAKAIPTVLAAATRFMVLVQGRAMGQYWNAATAVAHDQQKSHPIRYEGYSWIFRGEEPKPVSVACLPALPRDPCWGTG